MKVRSFIAAFAVLCCSATVVSAAEETVTLKPVDGVAFELPKGWKSCDEATDKRLGGADDPMSLGKQICPAYGANPDAKLTVFSPKVGWTATMAVLYQETAPLTGEMIGALTDEMMVQVGESVQKDWEQRVTQAGSKLDSTAVRKDTLAGHAALVSTIIQTPPAGALAQSITETWEVPVNGHLYQFNFTWAKLLEGNTKPVLDEIKASIKIE